MHFQFSFFSMIIVLFDYKISIAKEAKLSFFEPCSQHRLLGISRIANLNHFLFFYEQHYLELDLDNLLIVTFRKHSKNILKFTENGTCKFFSFYPSTFLLCDHEKYEYNHYNQSLTNLTVDQLSMFRYLKPQVCYLSIDEDTGLLLYDEKTYFCERLNEDCKSSTNFLTPYHLNKCKGSFITNNSITFFTADYVLHLKLTDAKLTDTKMNDTRLNGTRMNDTKPNANQAKNVEVIEQLDITENPIEESKSNKTIRESEKLAKKLIDQLLKDKKSVKKYFYKHLFGCSIIDFAPQYYLPFNRSLIDYHSNKGLYITNDLISTALKSLYAFTAVILSALLIAKFFNSSLIGSIESLLTKPRLSEQDKIFLQVRTEIENGVYRKLEKSDMSPKEINKSEIRILIDTLLHEQLYVNLINLDALKSVDLIRHLINEVVETIKVRRSEKSSEVIKKKYKSHYGELDKNVLLERSSGIGKSKLNLIKTNNGTSGSSSSSRNRNTGNGGAFELELDDLKIDSKSTKSKQEKELEFD